MKKKYIAVTAKDGKITSVYDLCKISEVFRVDDTSLRVIIDSVQEMWSYSDKQTCDNCYDWIVRELLKLNEQEE